MPVAQYPTLVDLASRLDQEGHIIPIAEVLSKRDPILKLLRWKECNKTDGYLHGIRTGIPEPTFRKLYQGVQPQKSTTAQVTDTCGNIEMYAEVDKDLADVNGNTAQWRLSEQTPFFQGMVIRWRKPFSMAIRTSIRIVLWVFLHVTTSCLERNVLWQHST